MTAPPVKYGRGTYRVFRDTNGAPDCIERLAERSGRPFTMCVWTACGRVHKISESLMLSIVAADSRA